METDWSDAAVILWAGDLVERWPEHVAVEHAQAYRSAYYEGTPGAAFWSRVIARLLTRKTEAEVIPACTNSTDKIRKDEPAQGSLF